MAEQVADGGNLGPGLLGELGGQGRRKAATRFGHDLDAALDGPPQLIIDPLLPEVPVADHFSDRVDRLQHLVEAYEVRALH